MAHFCGVETQKGGGCRRRVKAATCKAHVNGPVPRKGAGSNRKPVRPHQPPHEVQLHQQATPAEAAFISLPDAVAIVQGLPVHWRRRIAEQSERWFSRELWRSFLQQSAAGLCLPLAQTAREILAIKASVSRLPGEAVADAARHIDAPPVVQAMAKRFTDELNVTMTIEQKLEATAHGVRVLGIFVCVIANTVPSCQCLKDLVAENMPREELETSVWHLMEPTC